MAEGIVLNLVTSILGSLASQSLTEFARSGGIKNELQLLENSVSTIRAFLLDAEEKYHKSRAVAVWLQQLKDAFLDADDLLDEMSTTALLYQQRSNAVIKFFSSSNPFFLLKFMANRIRKRREQIDRIASGRSQLLHLVERPMIDLSTVRRRELTHSFVASEDIIGRDDAKSEIVNFLINSDFSILPIVGIGGLGKTAIAQCVFSDDTVNDHFEVQVWACVSDTFDLKSIMRQIIAGGSNKEVGNLEMEQLQTQLRRKLDGKKYLLILDDLWTENREEWLSLKCLLMGGAKGSKILITTRSLMVAKITGTVKEPYVLGSLSEQKSWSLFVQLAFEQGNEANDPELISIGKEILGKCKGVPLAIRTLGGLLFNKDTKAEWLSIQDKQLQDLTQTENDIIPILKLSYDNLPSHLKQCFVICSLFPKDHVMEKNNLVHLWMAQGFITSRNSTEDLEGIGEECFMDLVRRSFFQDLIRDEVGNVKSCKMHDLLHDVAKFVAGHESIAFDGHKSLRDISERTLHMSYHLTSDLAQIFPVLSNAKKMRSFILAGETWSTPLINTQPLCHDLLSRVQRLRHLDLPNAGIKALPYSIGKLKHLRQLDLSRNAITKLPKSIVKLVNLEVLKLRRCGWLKELPRGIQKMASLRCLDIQYCFALKYTPAGIGELTSLSTLPIFVLCGKASNCCARLGELGGLNNLRGSLMIRNIASSKSTSMECSRANLQRKHLLESLLLSFDDGNGRRNPINDEAQLEELQPHSNLSDLTILNYQGTNLPIWIRDTCLPNLVQISLYGCDNVVHLPPLHHFLHLKSLNLELLPMLKYFGIGVEDEISHQSFPCLTRLLIRKCPKLISVPLAPHLEDLDVRSSNELLLQKLLHLHKLKCLYIAEIEILQSFSEAWFGELISLETMTIWQLPRLKTLPRGTQYLAKLEQLEVHKCYELDLSVDEDGNPMQLHDLKSLQAVKLIDLPRLVSAPDWLLHLENLQCLCIVNCENLAALPEWLGDLKSLRRLEIIDCPKLVTVPEGIMRLESLEFLNIVKCMQLNEACKMESGQDWHKISHVPNFSEDL